MLRNCRTSILDGYSASPVCKGEKPRHRSKGLRLILFLAIALFGTGAQAQPAGKIPRIGFLSSLSPAAVAARIDAFRQGLRELGYVEGKNLIIEYRYADGKLDRLPDLAAELVRLKVDII